MKPTKNGQSIPEYTVPLEDKIDVVDLTASDEDYMICKIPFRVYTKLLHLVDGTTKKDVSIPNTKPTNKKVNKKKKERKIKGSWTTEEDALLLETVNRMGAKKWPTIAQYIDGRGGKQCRERYLNHLDPTINHNEFTEEEDEMIMSMYQQFGSQWSKMARKLIGRPANKIKNRWNSTLSKISGDKSERLRRTPSKKKRKKKKKRSEKDDDEDDDDDDDDDDDEEEEEEDDDNIFSLPRPPNMKVIVNSEEDYSPFYPRRSRRIKKGNHNNNDDDEKKKTLPKQKQDVMPETQQQIQKVEEVSGGPSSSDSSSSSSCSSSSSSIKSPPPMNTFIYPISSSSLSFLERRTGKKRKFDPNNNNGEEGPSRKKRKLDKEDSFDDIFIFDDSILSENPFPSPLSLERKSNKEYTSLMERNKRMNEMKSEQEKREQIALLDEKLGIGVSKLAKPEDELERMGYVKNTQYEDLTLSLNDSALFASDYGIQLETPSQLTLGLWSPKEEERGKGFLRIDVNKIKEGKE